VANSAISLIARPYAWNSQRPARIMKKLREIARTHIEKAAAGDMQAIKELADRLDGKPAQMLEHSGPDSEPITKVVNEIVHVYETREQIEFNDQTPLLEINPSKNGGNTH
jgi:hypothetical protein